MEHTKHELIEILESRLDALEREHAELCALLDELHQREEGPEPAEVIEDKARWMRGAKRELSELVRQIEGPNPERGTRTKPKQ